MSEKVISLKKDKSKAVNVIYGTVLALSLLTALDHDGLTPSRTMVVVLVTLIGVWAAKSYAYVIGGELAYGFHAKFSELLEILKETMWVLIPGIPILCLFTLAAGAIISLKAALYIAQWIIVLFLFATGFWLRRQANGTFIKCVIDGLIDCSVGILIVGLKFLL
jgi:hypothetical protein